MIAKTCLLLLLGSTLTVHAAPRPWKSANGQHSISGEFLHRDATRITIQKTDGKTLILPVDQLHPDDLAWIQKNHPIPGPQAPHDASVIPVAPVSDKAALPDPSAVFDQLVFGDTREQVLTKLKASQCVELTVGEVFLGRTGLNGIFRTRQKMGKLTALLNFDWTPAGTLKELTLETDSLPASSYQSDLEPSWKEFIKLLEMLYGKPIQKAPMPRLESLAAGTFTPSCLWTLEGGGSVLLGTACDDENYQIVVRFTQKKIVPVEFQP
jgi:hypothetical protein